MLFWQVPAPDEAMLISGSKHKDPDTQFRIVTGHGCFVMPIKQKARLLSLALRESEIQEECVTSQGIRLRVRAVAAFKVGDDPVSIANAARRFLAEQDRMDELVGRIFAGHLRSIVGGLTVEQIIRERDRLSQEVKEGSHSEMEKLGIVVDALQIQEIDDASGYINNLAAPHAAAVASQARIAAAKADQEATEREQQSAALKAQYLRDTELKQAGFAAETEQAKARSAQAGPLAQAMASQEVIQARTALAEREAQLTEKRLESEVRRPADAEAYKQRTLAEAARDTTKLSTEAEAFRQRGLAEAARDTTKLSTEAEANRRRAIAEADAEATKVSAAASSEAARAMADGEAYSERTTAVAGADAMKARADALAGQNQALIAANKLVDILPALVEAAATGIAGSNLTVLNGTDGVNEVVAGLVSQGMSIYETLRRSIPPVPAAPRPNGTSPSADTPTVAGTPGQEPLRSIDLQVARPDPRTLSPS